MLGREDRRLFTTTRTMQRTSHVAALSPDFTTATSVVYIDSILSFRIQKNASLPDVPKFGLLASSPDTCVYPTTFSLDILLTQSPISSKVSLLYFWLEKSTALQFAIDRQMYSIRIASIAQKYDNPNTFLASISCKQYQVATISSLSSHLQRKLTGLIKPVLISSIPSHWIRNIL